MTPSLRRKRLEQRTWRKDTKEDMAGKLTCDLGVGIGEGLEVGIELDVGVSAEMRSDRNLRCSIDRKGEYLTQGRDGAVEERRKIPRRRACC